jgi:hypothetical protein
LDPEEVLTIRHEAFISDPRNELSNLCRFVGVESAPNYLEDCSGIVFDSPRKTRTMMDWTPEQITFVRDNMINRFGFLSDYEFDNEAI